MAKPLAAKESQPEPKIDTKSEPKPMHGEAEAGPGSSQPSETAAAADILASQPPEVREPVEEILSSQGLPHSNGLRFVCLWFAFGRQWALPA
eukprot:scaffold465639_cov43-Prasinocladus_malaysianus.AAC.1